MPRPDLVLASASPRRRELLERLGLVLAVMPGDADESALPAELPRDLARRLAVTKCTAAWTGRGADLADLPFLGADTIVVSAGRILGKPADADEARTMLAQLGGRRHEVLTGTCVRRGDGAPLERVVTTAVTFRLLAPAELDAYVACDEWQGKAGGYAIQGIAAAFVTELRGSFTNVVGLPLAEVLADLRATGGLGGYPPPAFGVRP